MKQILLLIIVSSIGLISFAQSERQTLAAAELIDIVKSFHPVARQALLNIEMSEKEVLQSRGAFDPVLQMSAAGKELENQQYYDYRIGELKVPTWYGIELNAGIESVGGSRTDPEETPGRSNYAGISVPLLKNLVLDKRRAFLQQAKIMVSQSETERKAILNDLIYDALSVYWNWVQDYNRLQVIRDAQGNSEQRLRFTREMILLGERPGIDSVEALTQVQTLQLMLNEAETEVQNDLLELSTYTWLDRSVPCDLPGNIRPAGNSSEPAGMEYDLSEYNEYEEALIAQHPELELYRYKFQLLEINKRLKFQELLPVLNAKYNLLSKGNNIPAFSTPLFQNNFQYGLSFSMPLRLSDGRAQYSLAKLKIRQTNYDFELKRRSLLNKLKEYYNTKDLLRKQIEQQYALLQNQLQLQRGEERRFENGESSLFLINTREQKRIETQQKLVELIAKYYKAVAALKWVSGAFGQ